MLSCVYYDENLLNYHPANEMEGLISCLDFGVEQKLGAFLVRPGSMESRVASYAYVMERGTIALEGPSAAVRDDPALLRFLAP